MLPVSNPTPPDRVWRGRPESGEYATSSPGFTWDQAGLEKCTRLPITPVILEQLRRVWNRDPPNPDHVMLWAVCCVGFFGFLRSGEMAAQDGPIQRGRVH